MSRRLLLGVVLLLLLLPGLGPITGQDIVHGQGDPTSELFQLINEFRASLGLSPFQWNGALASAAHSHAVWMATNVIYSHTGEGGSTPLSRATAAGYNGYVSENIVGGTNLSPRQGLIWWQNSPVHYNTLTSTRYTEAAIGFATNGEQNMYVLVVGRPSIAPIPPAAGSAGNQAEPLIITPIQLAEPREDGSIVHVIQQGQALWTVAAYYDVDLDYLYLINGLKEADFLHPGDEVTVRLADGQEPPPTPTPPLTHTVREGESAWSIALQHGIELDFLYLLNSLSPNSMLQPGDEVVVRLAEGQQMPPTPTPPTTHIVQSGQSYWTIAANYGLTVEQLLALNGLSADAIIRPGDELVIREVIPAATPLPAQTAATPALLEQPSAAATPTMTPTPLALAAADAAPASKLQSMGGAAAAANQTDSVATGAPGAVGLLIGLGLVGSAVYVIARRQRVQ